MDHFTYKGQLCIVTDFCEGGDLAAALKRRAEPLPEPQLLAYLAQAALALQHVHSRAVLHRDLKTPNIFLTRCGGTGLARQPGRSGAAAAAAASRHSTLRRMYQTEAGGATAALSKPGSARAAGRRHPTLASRRRLGTLSPPLDALPPGTTRSSWGTLASRGRWTGRTSWPAPSSARPIT